jgi:hypothetical protein
MLNVLALQLYYDLPYILKSKLVMTIRVGHLN